MLLLMVAFAARFTIAYSQDTVHSVDYRILKTLQENRTPVGDRLWVSVSNTFVLSPAVPVALGVGGLVAKDPSVKESLYVNATEAGAAWIINAGVTMGLKAMLGRKRPWVAYSGDLVCLQEVRSYSFPSGHTSFAFTSATSLSLLYPQWYVVLPAYLWAGAVAFSRLYIGAHYPSDVLAGALIGVGSALFAHYIRLRLAPPPLQTYTPALSVAFRF